MFHKKRSTRAVEMGRQAAASSGDAPQMGVRKRQQKIKELKHIVNEFSATGGPHATAAAVVKALTAAEKQALLTALAPTAEPTPGERLLQDVERAAARENEKASGRAGSARRQLVTAMQGSCSRRSAAQKQVNITIGRALWRGVAKGVVPQKAGRKQKNEKTIKNK